MMKKFVMIALMAMPVLAFAQDKTTAVAPAAKAPENKFAIANPEIIFLELIISTNPAGAQTIRADFGREILASLSDKELIKQLSEMRSLVFPTVPDAMNYLSSLGYKFQQNYVTYDKENKPDATHMVFEKRMPRRQPEAKPRPDGAKPAEGDNTKEKPTQGPQPKLAPKEQKKK
ncbi:MAG: hypothetical protein ACK5BL_05020 [Flavobacteriales bacterium]|jgi:hypothetical protein